MYCYFALLGLLFASPVLSFEFEATNAPGVEYHGELGAGIWEVEVEEDNDNTRVDDIIIITGVSSPSGIQLAKLDNVFVLLDVEVREEDGHLVLQAHRLDYEQFKSSAFTVKDTTTGEIKTLNVKIKNLDDEPPSVTVGPCLMPENTTITLENASCTITVSDPDGFLDQTNFEIQEDEESTLFLIGFKPPPPGDSVLSRDAYIALQPGQLLDYEDKILYIFHLVVTDSAGHPTTPPITQIIVEVDDIPDMPPGWTQFVYTKSIQEKSGVNTIQVNARDGDHKIDAEINYKVADSSGFISIDKDNGTISIQDINRDAGPTDQVSFEVTAYEAMDPDSNITDTILLMIIDIDDNSGVIYIDGQTEPKSLEINIDENSNVIDSMQSIDVSDIDLGKNAMYEISLVDTDDKIEYSQAFLMIPKSGYENSSLTLTITDPKKLDYEDPDWKVIKFKMVTVGVVTPSNTDSIEITISLNDLNDEPPIFDQAEYIISIEETVPKGTHLADIKATDRDAEDAQVKHDLIGTQANQIMSIEEFGGLIQTIIDDAFDYEKQTEVLVQVHAKDKAVPPHEATAQLTIKVIDVNDEPPKLTIGRDPPKIDENQKDGAKIEVSISASDEDTTADLRFEILWNETYATKNSRDIGDEFEPFLKFVDIITVTDPNTNKAATAYLVIKEVLKDNTPDYEVFDTVYLSVMVNDDNTVVRQSYDKNFFVMYINNLNDNPPEFTDDTKALKLSVSENSDVGTLIGTIIATDVDQLNFLKYAIINKEDTPEDWIEIDENSGQLRVIFDKIDCDDPIRENLDYTLSVTDGDFTTSLDISIYIIDVNDNIPELSDTAIDDIFEDNGLEPEVTQDGSRIYNIQYTDKDRDAPFNIVQCNFAQTTSIYVLNRLNIPPLDDTQHQGIDIKLLNGATLDREDPSYPGSFTVPLDCVDNPTRQQGGQNPTSKLYSFKLKDVNDNKPALRTGQSFSISENAKKNEQVSTKVQAVDPDEGENGYVVFNLVSIKRFKDNNEEDPDVPQDLFNVVNFGEKEDKQASIVVAQDDLNNYWGTIEITLQLTDRGTPSLSDEGIVSLTVNKYNLKEPVIKFPDNGKSFYLSPIQNNYAQLKLYNDDLLQNFQANDDGQDKYVFEFSLASTANDYDMFSVQTLPQSQGQLQLKDANAIQEGLSYELFFTARISNYDLSSDSPIPYSKDFSITIQFFNEATSDPIFEQHDHAVSVKENELATFADLPTASYVVNIPELLIYYLPLDVDDTLFLLDRDTNVITLAETLDYEDVTSHTLRIQSSKSTTLNLDAPDAVKLTVTINVIDVNDNPPIFDKKTYYTSLLAGSTANTALVTVHATDVDTTSMGQLRYSISGPDASYFTIQSETGVISLRTAIDTNTQDYNIDVQVVDEPPESHTDVATVKIFTVTSQNIVNFKFENSFDEVNSKMSYIESVLNAQFGFESHGGNPTSDTTDATANRTNAPMYFIDTENNIPKKESEILKLVSDTKTFTSMRGAFINESLLLLSFTLDNDSQNLEELLRAWLIGVSVVLGALLMILLIAFILKTRTLNRRIQNLTSTKFGSQESNLNRLGLAAPTTNKHAIEGSNPVYNNEVDRTEIERRASVFSGDSDLIGVEDNEEFDYQNNNNYQNGNIIQ